MFMIVIHHKNNCICIFRNNRDNDSATLIVSEFSQIIILALSRGNPSSVFRNRCDTNQAVQPREA